jgi:hypothetical protein
MMFIPIWFDEAVLEPDAIAPPAACSSREMKSHGMNVIVYTRGAKRDSWAPKTTTIRAKQRYIAPERKAGAIVRVTRDLEELC